MKILCVKQPWANAIIHLGKDIENRTWRTYFRGRFLVMASSRPDKNAPLELWNMLPEDREIFGGIIGSVELVDVVTQSNSKWFQGPFGFVLNNPVPLPFISLKGRLGFFEAPDFLLREPFLSGRILHGVGGDETALAKQSGEVL